ncbi:IclR family transcriptional regulator [Pusillimonas sp. SM2304]|uniref:IclR family transcriptional regulator n=1 Tax=Pusillimonas sp. SM2304 TaxID=3073241 RepID=UPI0028766E4B|nr:IclR family transcriptional regulator [Pusillimonas sp. SM2304]MDS1142531.1 IclR family transcriptional regulator [Pusillimonas sp. SM2304]
MAIPTDRPSKPLSSIQKTCRILASMTDPRHVRLTDIAESAGLDVSTTLRILKELEHQSFVERDPVSKQYVLGPQVYAMHHAMVAGLDLRAEARPSLIRLSRKFGDTAILSMPAGWESVCIDLCFGDYPIRANYLHVGSRRPLGVGAGSLALLVAMKNSEQQAVLPLIHARMAKRYPLYSQAYLDEQLQRARACGYSMLLDVVIQKMGGLGIPVKGPDGQPIAALSIAALSERISSRERELAEALKEEVHAIERAWLP